MLEEMKIILEKTKTFLNSPRGITEVIATYVTVTMSQKLESMNETEWEGLTNVD